jgi:hypothetical protein
MENLMAKKSVQSTNNRFIVHSKVEGIEVSPNIGSKPDSVCQTERASPFYSVCLEDRRYPFAKVSSQPKN